jgi:hypothetical protein
MNQMISFEPKEAEMRARWLLIALPVSVAMGLMGCVDDDISFYIQQNQVPEQGCEVSTTADKFRGSGLLDVSLNLGYYMFPLVINNMRSSSSEDQQPERNNLHMRRFTVELESVPVGASGAETSFEVPVSGLLPPAGGMLAYAGVKVIKDSLAAKLNSAQLPGEPVIMVSLRAEAERSGETRESAEFLYPVNICKGCLVDMRTEPPDKEDTTTVSNVCGIPQDDPVTCYKAGSLVQCLTEGS